jgi:hypothetical protein
MSQTGLLGNRSRHTTAVAGYARRRSERGRAPRPVDGPPLLEQVADPERMLAAIRDLQARGDRAPGPDGIKPSDLGPRDAARLARDLAPLLKGGEYHPAPGRHVPIPKASGGIRVLVIRNYADRVVSRALLDLLQPHLDGLFLPTVYGFRPRRGVEDLLADLLADAHRRGCPVLATEDIRGAFDHVRLADVEADVARHVEEPALRRLIMTVVRGGDPARAVGLEQGDALSGLLLNLRLHHLLDLPLRDGPTKPTVRRYADDLSWAGTDVSECQATLDAIRDLLLPAGLTLKGKSGPPVDLRTGEAQLLGFTVSGPADAPRIGLDEKAWAALEEGLRLAYEERDPAERARTVLLGWVASRGPALRESERGPILDRLRAIAARLGFRESFPADRLPTAMAEAHGRWERRRLRALRSTTPVPTQLVDAGAPPPATPHAGATRARGVPAAGEDPPARPLPSPPEDAPPAPGAGSGPDSASGGIARSPSGTRRPSPAGAGRGGGPGTPADRAPVPASRRPAPPRPGRHPDLGVEPAVPSRHPPESPRPATPATRRPAAGGVRSTPGNVLGPCPVRSPGRPPPKPARRQSATRASPAAGSTGTACPDRGARPERPRGRAGASRPPPRRVVTGHGRRGPRSTAGGGPQLRADLPEAETSCGRGPDERVSITVADVAESEPGSRRPKARSAIDGPTPAVRDDIE